MGASFALPAIGEAISAAGAAIAGLVSWAVVAVGVAVVVVAGGISYLVYKSNSKDDDKGDSKDKGASGADNDEVKSNKGNTYDNKPSDNHSTTTKNPGLKGEPNSSVDIVDKDGNIITRRWFDKNGNQIRDLDMTNHGNSKQHPEVPHEHGPRK